MVLSVGSGDAAPWLEPMRRSLSLDPVRGAAAACAIFGLALFAIPCAQAAAPAAADPNETCLACHGDKDAKGPQGSQSRSKPPLSLSQCMAS